MGLGALFKHAPCLKAWKVATLVGYGSGVAASYLTSKVSAQSAPELSHSCSTRICLSCLIAMAKACGAVAKRVKDHCIYQPSQSKTFEFVCDFSYHEHLNPDLHLCKF